MVSWFEIKNPFMTLLAENAYRQGSSSVTYACHRIQVIQSSPSSGFFSPFRLYLQTMGIETRKALMAANPGVVLTITANINPGINFG